VIELTYGPAAREDVERLLETEDVKYQRMPLPHGLATRKGNDCEPTARAIFDGEDLAGVSLLDVGCCYGYYCYVAKLRGAARVVGVELDDERFRQAELLRGLYSLEIELVHGDFADVLDRERFDWVLLLNVLHHLPEPYGTLKRVADRTNRRMVVEFPTFRDAVYRKHAGGPAAWLPGLYDRLPLLGLVTHDGRSKWVFSPSAIEHMLTVRERLFRSVRFRASPINRGRVIAICDK